MQCTWKPAQIPAGEPRSQWPSSVFAFPKERKEPLIDAAHVHSAMARFDQVDGVSAREREVAGNNIRAAARYFGLDLPR